MIDREKLRQRFLRDALPVRLGNLSATLGRISSNARESKDQSIVGNLLDEAKHLIEWTAADADITTAAEHVEMQRLIALWQRAWDSSAINRSQRILLAAQAKSWSDKALDLSGLAG